MSGSGVCVVGNCIFVVLFFSCFLCFFFFFFVVASISSLLALSAKLVKAFSFSLLNSSIVSGGSQSFIACSSSFVRCCAKSSAEY